MYSRESSAWKVADFGLTSEGTASKLLETTMAKGTEGYRAPELILNKVYNNKVDVWSMGCVLHELATKKRLFTSDYAVLQFYVENREFSSTMDNAGNDQEVAGILEVVATMVQREPSQRPSASQLYDKFLGLWSYETRNRDGGENAAAWPNKHEEDGKVQSHPERNSSAHNVCRNGAPRARRYLSKKILQRGGERWRFGSS